MATPGAGRPPLPPSNATRLNFLARCASATAPTVHVLFYVIITQRETIF